MSLAESTLAYRAHSFHQKAPLITQEIVALTRQALSEISWPQHKFILTLLFWHCIQPSALINSDASNLPQEIFSIFNFRQHFNGSFVQIFRIKSGIRWKKTKLKHNNEKCLNISQQPSHAEQHCAAPQIFALENVWNIFRNVVSNVPFKRMV